MRTDFFWRIAAATMAAVILVALGLPASAQPGAAPSGGSAQAAGPGQRQGRGFGGFPGGGRGILGAVTEISADHFTIKTDAGDTYTVHFSVNTRILKQPPGQGNGRRQADDDSGGERVPPQAIKPTDIKVGDFITAGGEMDAAAKSIGAVFIFQIDPERAKQMREMQANYGKTWLAGRITAIQDTTITIEGVVDHASHAIAVDENTSFRQRRDSITLADLHPGEQLRAEGAVKGGVFVAATVTAMRQPNPEEGAPASTQPKPQ